MGIQFEPKRVKRTVFEKWLPQRAYQILASLLTSMHWIEAARYRLTFIGLLCS